VAEQQQGRAQVVLALAGLVSVGLVTSVLEVGGLVAVAVAGGWQMGLVVGWPVGLAAGGLGLVLVSWVLTGGPGRARAVVAAQRAARVERRAGRKAARVERREARRAERAASTLARAAALEADRDPLVVVGGVVAGRVLG